MSYTEAITSIKTSDAIQYDAKTAETTNSMAEIQDRHMSFFLLFYRQFWRS